MKRFIILIVSLLALLFGNGFYYVFFGQHKSMAKLEGGSELNLYEKCSIYTSNIEYVHNHILLIFKVYVPTCSCNL